jgi:glucokinase
MILAGDIGGTKTNLALFTTEGNILQPVIEHTFPSKDYAGLEEVVQEFLSQSNKRQIEPDDPITDACFGVAGPVVEGRCTASNLPWIVTTQGLKQALDLEAVQLINDLEATGYGIPTLRRSELITLNEGSPTSDGHAVLIAAGTGLGEAMLYWDGKEFKPIASEGGHADFAPRSELEIELLRYLLKYFARISYERVLSGPGLLNIYHFLKDSGYGEEPAWLAEKLKHNDPGTVISEAALADGSVPNTRCELCVKSLDLFVSIYGAEAGNMALKFMAGKGVYVGGGIAPRILSKLCDGTFMRAFTHKGRLSPLVEATPVYIILNPKTALYGAARRAVTFNP